MLEQLQSQTASEVSDDDDDVRREECDVRLTVVMMLLRCLLANRLMHH